MVLEDDVTVLDQAVAIGYSTIKKRDLTGSVASVGTDAISRSIPTSADQVLQGRAAGVQMTQNSGLPGGGTSIRIRGVNSLNSSNEPIIVIDGVVIDAQTGSSTDNALSQINPNDIETMDVLKDASATAIYGAQGANGVILITTKRGKAGQTSITLDAQGGVQTMAKYLELMDLPQYAEHYNTFAALRGATQRDEYADPSILPAGTDWQRELFKTAMMQQYNLSVTGGSEKTTYAITGGYLNQDGIAYGSSFERYTMRINLDVQAKEWLKIGASTNVSHSLQNVNSLAGSSEGLIQVALKQSPAVSARSIDGGYDGPEDANFAQSNPIGLARLLENHNKKSGVRSNIYLDFSILKGLSFRTEFSNDINFANSYNFTPTYKFGSIFNSENNVQPANMASFLFTLKENSMVRGLDSKYVDFNHMLQDDENFKIIFILFYAAIIYHVAEILKAKNLEMPRHISFSGNGSKLITVLTTENQQLATFTKRIIEHVVGKPYDKELEILGFESGSNPKESTCKGGLLGDILTDDRDKIVIKKAFGPDFISKEDTYDRVDDTYINRSADAVKTFFDFVLNELDDLFDFDANFGVSKQSVQIAREECYKDIATYLRKGLQQRREESEGEDRLEETLFFFPIKGAIHELSNAIFHAIQ